MLVAKQVADFLTFSRLVLVFGIVYLGIGRGAEGISMAAMFLILSWTSDSIDGPIARRSRVNYKSWLGDHDLEIDMAVAGGLLVYMVLSGFISLAVGAGYCLVWLLVFWYWGTYRSLGMLSQAPVYGWFIWISLSLATAWGIALVMWILGVVALTWPRFPEEVIPGFLEGMKLIREERSR